MSERPFRTRVKFCGLTRPGDVRFAGEIGVDAVGFVFAQDSPRQLDLDQARWLRQALPPMVALVALFRDGGVELIRRVVDEIAPAMLQFHGDEDEALCRSFGLPYLRAIAMDAPLEAAQAAVTRYPSAAAFLLDGHAPGQPGGGGRRFDWSRPPQTRGRPWVLAGGLTPDNIDEAIRAARPWGVDVSSGIESAPGIKDGEKMRRFLQEVRSADCSED